MSSLCSRSQKTDLEVPPSHVATPSHIQGSVMMAVEFHDGLSEQDWKDFQFYVPDKLTNGWQTNLRTDPIAKIVILHHVK